MGWKAMARQAYGDELKRKAQVLEFNQTLRYLREYSGDTLYFPTYFDWRGRLYFRSRINPQSTDFVKAVLQFGNKKALGKRGLYWLKVHVATCYGFDKKGMDTRACWTDDNMELIRDAVENHIDSDFFRGADSPWCFFVAARELVRALDSGSPETWESGVPVAMDATCSGMQHLSAVLRDPVGGMFTNLMPNNGDEKEDIYSAVAAVAVSLIQKDTENLEMAKYWLDAGVPRSAAKRPVMTYVYGGTLMSCTDYVFLDMQERGLEGLPEFSAFKLAAYLSKYLRKGIESTVPSAAAAMRFLRELAGKSVSGEAMQWVTPAGFPVIQQYAQEEVVKLNLPAVGVQLNMTRFDDSKLNRPKCVNGIAPNFVHSLDSAHLVRVINAFVGSLVPIHDSFATHPCDVDQMHVVLRQEFVSMYADSDPLQVLVDAVESDNKPEAPPRGSLDIQRVLGSEFFMC
jgi:DNA-directed RNA polymerase